MSTSAMGGRSPASPEKPSGTKKLSSCVRPGVFDVRARPLWPVSALMSDDFPTLERPAKAISGGPSGGRNFMAGTPRMNTQGRVNRATSRSEGGALAALLSSGPVIACLSRYPKREALIGGNDRGVQNGGLASGVSRRAE